MSHIVEAKTQIEHPDPTLLRQAVELVASQQDEGRIEKHYYTFEQQERRTHMAIFTRMMHRGMAVEVKKGQLVFVGDSWGYEDHYRQVQQQIIQSYVSLATMQALRQMGYQTTAEDGEAGQIVIAGVSYA